MVIAPAEDCFWPDLKETDMRLKIRVRRMKEGRELRGEGLEQGRFFPPSLMDLTVTPST